MAENLDFHEIEDEEFDKENIDVELGMDAGAEV
jgi:hypothetical protein